MGGQVDRWAAEREPWTEGHMAEQAGLAEELDIAQMGRRDSFCSRGHKGQHGDCGHRK